MSSAGLPPVPQLVLIRRRLQRVFPEGMQARRYLVRESAARTIFVMFYLGAIEGTHRWIRPNQVTRMTNAQARKHAEEQRSRWAKESLRAGTNPRRRWYADTTRESIRDETLRNGLLRVGAVVERPGLSPTSGAPRWALREDFARLFVSEDAEFETLAGRWRETHLSREELARTQLLLRGSVARSGADRILVTFPNGETRRMSPGLSSLISQSVIEEFARKYLHQPGVIFLSETRATVVARDDELARAVGLHIPSQKLLPDIVLVDTGPTPPLLMFVEVVASDGAITLHRKKELSEIAERGGYASSSIAFVTAYWDRHKPVFRRTIGEVAPGTFVWCASEPDLLFQLHAGSGRLIRLDELARGS